MWYNLGDMWFGVELAGYVSLILGYLLLLILVVRHRNGRRPRQRWLEVTLLLAVVWTLLLGLLAFLTTGSWWSYVWHRTAQIGLVILALTTAEFADAFVELPPLRVLRIGVVALLSAMALALDTFHPYLPPVNQLIPYVRWGYTELATFFWLAAWAVSTLTAWWTSFIALRQATGAKHRNRIRYLFAALFSFVVGDLLLWIGGVPDVYVGLFTRLFGFCIITFAILRYDLPDLRRLTLATIRAVLLVGLTAFLYLVALLVFGLVFSIFSSISGLTIAVPALVLALLLAAAVEVGVGPRLHRFLDRRIMGQDYDVQKALRAYSERVSLILDLERLADTTLEWIRATLRVERAAFILLTPQDSAHLELRVLRATDDLETQPKLFDMDNRFIVHFYKLAQPLSQYDLDMLTWFQVMPPAERRWLEDLKLDLYVPVLVGEWPVALLALGPKAGGQPYSEADVETLMTLAGQAGTALENARLMDDLRAVQDDLHRLSDELAETNRQLARLDQTKTDFVAIASHELRTPLTQIYGYSDILGRLEGDDLSDSQVIREFVEGISKGASRLKQVVDAMVDVSLIETDSLKIHPVVTPLKIIVDNAVGTVHPAVEKRRQEIVIHNLADLPYIQADGPRLEQVFVSLLTNAIKFTPDGGKIEISGRLTASESSDKAYVEVLVADAGIGIDADQLELVFEKFYRGENLMLHSTDSTRFKGAGPGLGLAIAKGIVDAHQGRLWVESPGRNEETCPGSIFHVRLPITGPEE